MNYSLKAGVCSDVRGTIPNIVLWTTEKLMSTAIESPIFSPLSTGSQNNHPATPKISVIGTIMLSSKYCG